MNGIIGTVNDALGCLLGEDEKKRVFGEPEACGGVLGNSLYNARARLEYDREQRHARHLLAMARPIRNAVPNADYWRRHDLEVAWLAPLQPRRILCIGSGPYPTSAIALHDGFPAASVTGLDRSAKACRLSRQVAAALGCDRLRIVCADALEIEDFSSYDCVIVGSLVLVDGAERIARHLADRVPAEAALVFRVGSGAGAIKYPGLPAVVLETYRYRVCGHAEARDTTLLLLER